LCGSSFDTYISAIDPQGNVLAYNDDAPSCAPASQITIPCAGQDSVYIIVEGWNTNSGSYVLNITQGFVGIQETEALPVKLTPNPAASSFVIQNVMNASVNILDVAGNSVMRITDYSGEEINTDLLADGIYTVECSNGNASSIQKLVIAR
jgi:hypothetical protein